MKCSMKASPLSDVIFPRIYRSKSQDKTWEVFLLWAHRVLFCTQYIKKTWGRQWHQAAFIFLHLLFLHSHLPSLPKTLNPVPSLLTGNIPHAHSLIQACRHHQVLRGMELSAHHIVIMSSQHTTEKRQQMERYVSVFWEKTFFDKQFVHKRGNVDENLKMN